jgi:hypothetical protein
MTYGVVITLLVLALIATVISITVSSNQPTTVDPEPVPDADTDAAHVQLADESTPTPTTAVSQAGDQPPFEEIAQPGERDIPEVPETTADDTRSLRL